MPGDSRPKRHLRAVGRLASLSDEDLMCLHRDGDVAAFDLLVHRYRRGLHRYLTRMTRDPERAEELLADVFLKIHRAAPRYEPTAKFSTYVYTVAYRAALNANARAHQRKELRAGGSAELETHQTPTLAPSADPERSLRVKRDFTRLQAELDDLPASHSSVFLLYYLQGMSCAEIAVTTGISAEEAKGRLAYARKLLRGRLTAEKREHLR